MEKNINIKPGTVFKCKMFNCEYMVSTFKGDTVSFVEYQDNKEVKRLKHSVDFVYSMLDAGIWEVE